VAAGGRMSATKWHVVLAAWTISHGGAPVMCGCGGSRRKGDCNQAGHLQYCIFVELKFFNKLKIMLKKCHKKIIQKVIKKLSTFVGDSTYTNAPPTHRSPWWSNN